MTTPTHDARTLVALVATAGDLTVPHALDLLDWTDERLDTALDAADQHLEATGLQLAVSHDHLTLQLQPGVLPEPTRARLDHSRLRRRPLSTRAAADLLKLARDHLLEPFPGADPEEGDLDPLAAATLADADLAVITRDQRAGTTRTSIHPDVLYALRLTSTPPGAR